MQMDRVMAICAQVHHTDANAIANLCDHRCGAWKRLGVEGKDVEISHLVWIWTRGVHIDSPFTRQERKIPIRTRSLRVPGVDDKDPHRPKRHLRHLVMVRVVHVGAVLAKRVLVLKRFARLDASLRQSGHTVHSVW